jgi:RNA 2',3'-cyclic 3'-phosphodiesterase
LRSFIAVDVSAIAAISELQNKISSVAGWSSRDVKPVEPQNFHFTLLFLGETAESDVERVRSRLSGLRFEPADISYSGVGAFPRPDAARVVWVGVDREGSQKLSEIANKVATSLAELGFTPDKPFSPHLTIFRVKSKHPLDVSALVERHNGSIATDRIDKVHLKKSELLPSGPIYSNVYTVQAGN